MFLLYIDLYVALILLALLTADLLHANVMTSADQSL